MNMSYENPSLAKVTSAIGKISLPIFRILGLKCLSLRSFLSFKGEVKKTEIFSGISQNKEVMN